MNSNSMLLLTYASSLQYLNLCGSERKLWYTTMTISNNLSAGPVYSLLMIYHSRVYRKIGSIVVA